MKETAPAFPLHIFIVENHADTLHALQIYLEESGHTVLTAHNLAEAREKWPSDFDVLISDIGLPDGTGWELLEKVKLPDHVYAIAMSGFGMNADNVRSRAAGFRHHLLKPFKPVELDKLLEEATALMANR